MFALPERNIGEATSDSLDFGRDEHLSCLQCVVTSKSVTTSGVLIWLLRLKLEIQTNAIINFFL